MKKSVRIPRPFVPRLERLEDRLVPAVFESPFGAPFVTAKGVPVQGQVNSQASFIAPNGDQKVAYEDPIRAISVASSNFATAFTPFSNNGWTFIIADADAVNPAINLTVQSCFLSASSTVTTIYDPNTKALVQSPGGNVNLDFEVKNSNPLPGGIPDGWIQVVTTNFPLPGKDPGPNLETYLDNRRSTTSPFYPNTAGSESDDFTARVLSNDDVEWHAQMFYAVATGPKEVTVYGPGVAWGWHSVDSSSPWETTSITVTSKFNPVDVGQKTTLTAILTPMTDIPTGNVSFVDTTTNKVIGTALIKMSNGQPKAWLDTSFGTAGPHNIQVTYDGDVNYYGVRATVEQTVIQRKADLQLNPAANVVALGQAATFTATLSDDDSTSLLVPTGTVTFADGSTVLGTGTLDATGHASFVTAALSLGTHTITATYGGDATFDTATGSAPEEVDAAGSVGGHVFIDANGNGIQDIGEIGLANVTLTLAGPSNRTAVTDGTGTFVFNNVLLGNYAVSVAGPPGTALEGYFQNGTPSTGSVALTADHPDADLDAAFVSAMASTTTSLTVSNPTPTVGDPLTLTATVALTVGWGNPSGTVQFLDGTTILGVGVLSGTSVSSLTITSLAAGTHHLTAVYLGSPTYSGSTSADGPVTVLPPAQQAPASVALSSSSQLAGAGQFVTFSAVVSSTAGGTPSGTVTFLDGSTPLGTATLSQGACSFSTSALSLGVHGIIAAYNGSASYAGVSSSALVETIQAMTQVMLTESSQTSGLGWPVTFTATVYPSVLGGTVSYYDNGVLIATIALEQGMGGMRALLTTSALVVGTHTITARYNGDAPSSMWMTFVVFQIQNGE
jgi:hypothetical protein